MEYVSHTTGDKKIIYTCWYDFNSQNNSYDFNSKKKVFIKEQDTKGLLNTLRLKTLISNVPVLRNIY